MADRLDVAGRLAEGRAAVDHAETYVRACQALGYGHPDLIAQLRDAYDGEEGLDLHVLDGDCAQLRAAGAAVGEALQLERAQLAALATAWTGPAADNAVRFLERHCAEGTGLTAELRAAAQRSESLRDNLWQLVDAKVATTIAIDDRTLAHRPAWLAAAAAVTSGAGDRSTAEALVREQVMPHVDNDIGNEWRSAMQSARVAVQASYDMVTDRMAGAAHPGFEIPGDLGPTDVPPRPAVSRAPLVAAGTSGADMPYRAGPLAASPNPAGAPADSVATAPNPPTAPTAAPNSPPGQPMPDLGSGLGGASGMPASAGAGGLGGLASRIVSALGDALGGGDDFDEEDDPFGGDAAEDDDEHTKTDQAEKAEKADVKKEPVEEEEPKPDEPIQGAVNQGAPPPQAQPQPVTEPKPGAEPVTPPVAAPPAAAPTGGKTPCEIAADELPQAGR